MLDIIRENLGIVALVALFTFHRACKLYMKKLQQTLYNPILRIGSFVSSYPVLEKCGHKGNTSEAHYHKKRHIGVEFFVVHSAELASKLCSLSGCFEDSTFIARTVAFSRALLGISSVGTFLPFGAQASSTTSADIDSGNSQVEGVNGDPNQRQRPEERMTNGQEDINWENKSSRKSIQHKEREENNRITITKSYNSVLTESFLNIKYCVKELIILLEAKSNRKDVVDIKKYGYRHAVNVLGVCVFGKKINELTNSRCRFYDHCDELYEFWVHSEKHRLRKYVDNVLVNMGILEIEKPVAAVEFFKKLVRNCFEGKHDGYENCLAKVLADTMEHNEESIEMTASFLIAFSVNMLEVMGGVMSLMLHELSADAEIQEKIRNNDKVEFDLEGVPRLNLENIVGSTFTDTLIKKTFKTHAIDPVIQLTCKQSYSIPETNIQINPKCVVLIPTHVLPIDNNLHHRLDEVDLDNGRKMDENIFITDRQAQLVSVFLRRFVDMCLKTSLTSLIQEYEFKTDIELNYENVTSCRFSTLPTALPLRAARVEKRGKVVIFEESLKAFYASKDVPFLSKIGL